MSSFEVKKIKLLYDCKEFNACIVSTTSSVENSDIKVESASKFIFPTIIYNEEGNFRLTNGEDFVDLFDFKSKYVSKDPEYSQKRINDSLFADFNAYLASFPVLNKLQDKIHPFSLYTYNNSIKLQPSQTFQDKLNKLNFIDSGKAKANALEKLFFSFKKKYPKFSLDLFSIPKHDVGDICYLASSDGISKQAIDMGFGFAHIMPKDRIIRELGSLKTCEKFSNPIKPKNYSFPDYCLPFITTIRVAFIATENSMLDSGDLMSSGIKKLSCILEKEEKEKDLTLNLDNSVLKYQNSRSCVEAYKSKTTILDESKIFPGSIRLVLPGGLKVNTQCVSLEKQALCSKNQKIDLLLDFRSVSSKGAINLIATCLDLPTNLTYEETIQKIKESSREVITYDGVRYYAYVGDIPVWRPSQRYTELSKISQEVTNDIITKAILKEKQIISSIDELNYQEIKTYINTLRKLQYQ
jgi:hypothetical protein